MFKEGQTLTIICGEGQGKIVTVKSIEEKLGFRQSYQYQYLHTVDENGEEIAVRSWEVYDHTVEKEEVEVEEVPKKVKRKKA